MTENSTMPLPGDIQEIFFQTLFGDKSVLDFEQWLYADKCIELIIAPEDYLDLIAHGYAEDRISAYDLYRLLEKHIDKGAYEKWRLLRLLEQALQQHDNLPQILTSFYNLYCKGYGFLRTLGLCYGHQVDSYDDDWKDLSPLQQKELLNSFYPAIEYEIRQVAEWLHSGKIVLTGVVNEYHSYEYIDNRAAEEKSF